MTKRDCRDDRPQRRRVDVHGLSTTACRSSDSTVSFDEVHFDLCHGSVIASLLTGVLNVLEILRLFDVFGFLGHDPVFCFLVMWSSQRTD